MVKCTCGKSAYIAWKYPRAKKWLDWWYQSGALTDRKAEESLPLGE